MVNNPYGTDPHADRPPVTRTDAGISALGALAFIVSFFPWVGLNLGPFGNYTADAWNVGFFAWFPMLLCLAVGAAVAAHAFLGMRLPAAGAAGPRTVLGGVGALAMLILLIRMVTLIAQSGGDNGTTQWALYAAFITAAVQLALGYAALREGGEEPALRAGLAAMRSRLAAK